MDGLLNLSGQRSVTVEINGKQWTFDTAYLRDYAEMEQYILSHRPDPLEGLAGLPDDVRADAVRVAMQQRQRSPFVSMSELAEFESSVHGVAWRVWRALRNNHPEIAGIDDAYQFIEDAGNEHWGTILTTLDIAEEKDLIKNSESPV
jgi:hypothetical protein